MMLKREALSILHHVYAFCRENRNAYCKIPTTVVKELCQVLSILPLLRCSVYTEWHPIVHASDASPFGIGVCSTHLGSSCAGIVGRVSERWRFKMDSHISARRYALGIEPSITDKGIIDGLSAAELTTIENSPEFIIPGKILSPQLWKLCHSRRVHGSEHITRIEGRALSTCIRHCLRNSNHMERNASFSLTTCLCVLGCAKVGLGRILLVLLLVRSPLLPLPPGHDSSLVGFLLK